jgi:hypothetical protein
MNFQELVYTYESVHGTSSMVMLKIMHFCKKAPTPAH